MRVVFYDELTIGLPIAIANEDFELKEDYSFKL